MSKTHQPVTLNSLLIAYGMHGKDVTLMKGPLRRFLARYKWFFVAEGVFGNFLFFVGSVLFLRPGTERFGVWLFIAGSGLMLVSSCAVAMSEAEV
jgi:hypothetical protein